MKEFVHGLSDQSLYTRSSRSAGTCPTSGSRTSSSSTTPRRWPSWPSSAARRKRNVRRSRALLHLSRQAECRGRLCREG
ncbi:MAG: hypothetical protein MZV70_11685 [Desulfobacterales bacterium]|nr:hypothetical protein [Desulfobacterales bacterium]